MGQKNKLFLKDLKAIGKGLGLTDSIRPLHAGVPNYCYRAMSHSAETRAQFKPLLLEAIAFVHDSDSVSILEGACQYSELHEEIVPILPGYLEEMLQRDDKDRFLDLIQNACFQESLRGIVEDVLPYAFDVMANSSPYHYGILVKHCMDEQSDLAVIEPSLQNLIEKTSEKYFLVKPFQELIQRIQKYGTESLKNLVAPYYVLEAQDSCVLMVSFKNANPAVFARNQRGEVNQVSDLKDLRAGGASRNFLKALLNQVESVHVPAHEESVNTLWTQFKIPDRKCI